METTKPTHTIVLDSGPIIKNEPAISSLLSYSEALVTTPTVLSEIRDAATRTRVETLLKPFLTIRQPKPASLQLVAQFARKTGDYAVLSKTDLEVIALTYDVECERNGGDWRLRSVPGQKHLNGSPPSQTDASNQDHVQASEVGQHKPEGAEASTPYGHADSNPEAAPIVEEVGSLSEMTSQLNVSETPDDTASSTQPGSDTQCQAEAKTNVDDQPIETIQQHASDADFVQPPSEDSAKLRSEDTDSDSDGWVTPSNYKKHQAKAAESSTSDAAPQKTIQAAVITTDFPMQNVILQMNLNLLSASLQRVRHIKSFVLRCHACFGTTRDMSKQFCPRCGKPTLTKVTCSTNMKGEFQLHLKKNFQWNKRGDRYSIPKPVHGASHGRVQGGGKGSWGNDLLLAEDQKEYQRAVTAEKRHKQRDLMDEDFLPSILSGQRNAVAGRPKVGAGRNVNSKKRNG